MDDKQWRLAPARHMGETYSEYALRRRSVRLDIDAYLKGRPAPGYAPAAFKLGHQKEQPHEVTTLAVDPKSGEVRTFRVTHPGTLLRLEARDGC